jgi:hypothetical protein
LKFHHIILLRLNLFFSLFVIQKLLFKSNGFNVYDDGMATGTCILGFVMLLVCQKSDMWA